jgi:hypothetical protein
MKILGGIGYILNLIPIVNFIAPILIGIAWIQMGGKTRITLFKAAGAFYIATFIIAIAVIAIFFGAFLDNMPIISAAIAGQEFDPSLAGMVLVRLLGMALTLVVLGIVLGIIGLITFILELAAHFRAGSVFNVAWFKAAAWLRILLIIIVILLVGVLFYSITSTPLTGLPTIFSQFTLVLIAVIIPGILAQIFSAIAFFTIPELPPPPQ